MKLRMRDNSVRLRLMRGEVDTLRRQGKVSAHTAFPGAQALRYAVVSSAEHMAPAASLADHVLTVHLPQAAVLAWAGSEQVSISGVQPLSGSAQLAILVEKDFACLAPRDGEDESDMFPHPYAKPPSRRTDDD